MGDVLDMTGRLPKKQPAWGSVFHHARTMSVIPKPYNRRRCPFCPKGFGRKATHAGQCNGVCLMTGCEMHVKRWVSTGRADAGKGKR